MSIDLNMIFYLLCSAKNILCKLRICLFASWLIKECGWNVCCCCLMLRICTRSRWLPSTVGLRLLSILWCHWEAIWMARMSEIESRCRLMSRNQTFRHYGRKIGAGCWSSLCWVLSCRCLGYRIRKRSLTRACRIYFCCFKSIGDVVCQRQRLKTRIFCRVWKLVLSISGQLRGF